MWSWMRERGQRRRVTLREKERVWAAARTASGCNKGANQVVTHPSNKDHGHPQAGSGTGGYENERSSLDEGGAVQGPARERRHSSRGRVARPDERNTECGRDGCRDDWQASSRLMRVSCIEKEEMRAQEGRRRDSRDGREAGPAQVPDPTLFLGRQEAEPFARTRLRVEVVAGQADSRTLWWDGGRRLSILSSRGGRWFSLLGPVRRRGGRRASGSLRDVKDHLMG